MTSEVVRPPARNRLAALGAMTERAFAALEALWPNGDRRAVVRRYGDELRVRVMGQSYGEFPATVRAQRDDLFARGGTTLVAAFHRCVLLDATAQSREILAATPMLADVTPWFEDAASRWMTRLFETQDERLDHSLDSFAKDLSVASLRVWPLGAQVIEPRMGIPRSILGQGGVRTFVRGALLSARMGGYRPLYQLHTYDRSLHEFTRDGWIRCYERIARLLANETEVKGVFGATWWYDPQVARISPRLAYLLEEPVHGGAEVLRVSPTRQTKELALSRDAERRALYEQGKYSPREYILIWPRDRILAWAERRGALAPASGTRPA